MANILVVNDYPLVPLEADVRAGRAPNHLLYGVDYLKRRGHKVVDISGVHRQVLARLDRRLLRSPIPVGNIDQQLRVLENLDGIDVIYTPCQLRMHLLSLARARGLFKTPLVCLVHHPLVRGRAKLLRQPWWRAVLGDGVRGTRFGTLSTAVANELNEVARAPVAKALTWGPDADFYPPPEYPGVGVVLAGRTGRDFVTLARAARVTGTPVTILSWSEYLAPIKAELDAPNIEVIPIEAMIPHSEIAARFAKARAVVVPLVAGHSLSGLTGVMDAIGAGKPLLVTRNPTLDLDPDRYGFGHSLGVGDVEGWIGALRELDERPDVAVAMGRRARALVDGGMTSESFGAQIEALIGEALA